jgi:hypothetical protein
MGHTEERKKHKNAFSREVPSTPAKRARIVLRRAQGVPTRPQPLPQPAHHPARSARSKDRQLTAPLPPQLERSAVRRSDPRDPPIDVRAGRALATRSRAGGACLRATCRARVRVQCARHESKVQRVSGSGACAHVRAAVGVPAAHLLVCAKRWSSPMVMHGGRGAHRTTDDVSCTRPRRTWFARCSCAHRSWAKTAAHTRRRQLPRPCASQEAPGLHGWVHNGVARTGWVSSGGTRSG